MLRCRDGSLYTGWTVDLERRLACHRAGVASRYTASRLPVELALAVPMVDRTTAVARRRASNGCPALPSSRFSAARESDLDVDNHHHPALTGPVAAWRVFKRLTQLSFPRSYPIVQFPNAPLILAFAAGLLASNTHGREHSYAQSISYLAMAIWAYLELFHGVNAFRRLLGLAYTISTAVHLATALHH